MKIYAICIVKNECDVIAFSLSKASEWAEKIFVLDNGSDDNTWEIVNTLADSNKKIIPWKVTNENFKDGIRANVFNEFRHFAEEGDWWCARLDADEIYLEDPRDVIAGIEPYAHVLCSKHIQYRLTKDDLNRINFDKKFEEYVNEIKYIEPQAHSEVRFFKHRNALTWNKEDVLPKHIGIVSGKRIILKHYQYRSALQIQKRLNTRLQTRINNQAIFPHVDSDKLMDYIFDKELCLLDNGDESIFHKLPYTKNIIIGYRWWVLILRRLLHFSKILP